MRMMDVDEFQDRDTGYLDWVAAHPDGYVINIDRSGYARLHRNRSRPVALGQRLEQV